MRMTALNGVAAGAMAVALGLGAASCTTPAPGGTAPGARVDAPAARLEALISLDRRVAAVGYRLTTASVDLCASRRDVAGWAVHAANQYSDALRPVAEARFGLDGDLPGILAVAEDSPAARAGLTAGDLLVRVNGEDLDRGAVAGSPSHDGLAANLMTLDRALAAGPVRLDVRRGDLQVGIFNVYNRFNAQSISFRQSTANVMRTEAVQLSVFGIVPSISYTFKF